MKAYQYSMIGLILDIIGAFLVSVEAIKLENVRLFRDRLVKLEPYTRSPVIVFVDPKNQRKSETKPSPKRVPANRYVGLFMGLHYVAGFVVLIAANKITHGFVLNLLMRAAAWTLNRPWYIAVLVLLVFIVYGLGGGVWMLGELVHVAIMKSLTATIGMLDFIDSRTPDGTVGLIGFLLLFFGFLFQMLGSYVGRPAN